MLKLNLGCGADIRPKDEGWVNIDIMEREGVDLLLDLEQENLPYAPDSVDMVNMQDVLEHLPGWRQIPMLRNVYSILKPGGHVYIQVPHLKVLAKRYLDVLENPTEMQHPLSTERFCMSLYGGQEYPGNFHKWGYDEEYLAEKLYEVGFAVYHLAGDGGQNLLCSAFKSYDTVYIKVGGGLGDAMQIYLTEASGPEDFQCTSDPTASLWFQRLRSFREKYPDKKVIVASVGHNKATVDFFSNHPYIDDVVTDKKVLENKSELARTYRWQLLDPDKPSIYLKDDERVVLDKLCANGPYVVMQPFAGMKHRDAISVKKYIEIANALVRAGLLVVVVGASDIGFPSGNRIISLVNVSSTRLSTAITLSADGFVGCHSCMVLVAWHAEIPTYCIVPPKHDAGQPWMDFFNSGNPTTWASGKDFNKTAIVEKDEDINIEEIVDFIRVK